VKIIMEYHLWSDRKSCRLMYLSPAIWFKEQGAKEVVDGT
jgi:hypothetical protein